MIPPVPAGRGGRQSAVGSRQSAVGSRQSAVGGRQIPSATTSSSSSSSSWTGTRGGRVFDMCPRSQAVEHEHEHEDERTGTATGSGADRRSSTSTLLRLLSTAVDRGQPRSTDAQLPARKNKWGIIPPWHSRQRRVGMPRVGRPSASRWIMSLSGRFCAAGDSPLRTLRTLRGQTEERIQGSPARLVGQALKGSRGQGSANLTITARPGRGAGQTCFELTITRSRAPRPLGDLGLGVPS